MDQVGGWLGVVAIAVSVLTAAGGIVLAYLGNARTTLERLNQLQKQIFAQQDELGKLRDQEHDCLRREADLKAEVTALRERMKSVEAATGLTPPPALAGIVVADLKGAIQEYSPALVPILGYLPSEMVGKNVAVLVPPELREAHCRGLEHHAADPDSIDPGREILTYALAKNGSRVPVAITLKAWRTGGEGLITATVKQRLPDKGDQ